MASTQTTPKSSPEPATPIGYQPLTEFIRVRTVSGIYSTDADGQTRHNSRGEAIESHRGELLPCSHWRHSELLLKSKAVLPVTMADYEAAPQCSHGARFAADAFPGEACKCEASRWDTGRPWKVQDGMRLPQDEDEGEDAPA